MMFKGTKKFGIETWGNFLNSKGAEMNAFTSLDYTGYYINAPAENIDLLLQIESDRMRNLKLDPKDVNSEREVVKEERRMRYEDNIEGGIREKMSEIMYKNLPYRWLPIGSMVDLNAASMDDLRAFYKTFYSPGNAVLVVAGAFQTDQVKKLIEKYYGKINKEDIVRPIYPPEAPQKAETRATIDREAQAPSIAVGYRLPDQSSKDHYALDLLAIVLGQGQSSRLHKEMVYKSQVALSVSAYSSAQALSGFFMIGAGLKPKADVDKALAMMERQTKSLRNTLLSQKELDKARNIFMKDYVDGLKRVSSRARQLANYEIVYGDYTRIFTDLKAYQAVTREDVKRVAQAYLQPYQRNIVIVRPKKSGGPS
jgi:zinc protease